jgi:hypothetical protein
LAGSGAEPALSSNASEVEGQEYDIDSKRPQVETRSRNEVDIEDKTSR